MIKGPTSKGRERGRKREGLILTFLSPPRLLTVCRSLRPMFYIYRSVAICQLILYEYMDMDMDVCWFTYDVW